MPLTLATQERRGKKRKKKKKGRWFVSLHRGDPGTSPENEKGKKKKKKIFSTSRQRGKKTLQTQRPTRKEKKAYQKTANQFLTTNRLCRGGKKEKGGGAYQPMGPAMSPTKKGGKKGPPFRNLGVGFKSGGGKYHSLN